MKEEFLKRIKNILGENYTSYIASMQNPPTRALRFNPEKSGLEHIKALEKYLVSPLSFWENAYVFSHDKIGTHPYHHAGAIYVQEPSAMAPVASVDIPPDARVLDMCASPGGKSTQVLSRLRDGFLVSNEIVMSRCRVLSGNIERLGFKNAAVTCTDTTTLSKLFPCFFDLVIADVPCSGEGMFRKDEGAVNEWSEENVETCAKRGKEILDNAAICVAEGGTLIFSTCTFSLEENEENVKWFLENHPDFKLISPHKRVLDVSEAGIGLADTRRIYPHGNVGEGQFFALFKKVSGDRCSTASFKSALTALDKNDEKIVREFLEKHLLSFSGSLMAFHENAVLVPENLPVPEKVTYSCGVTLGRVEKGVFRPHHHLFSALGHLFKNKIELHSDDERIKKYLHGETFSATAPDGWACVTTDKIPLGGVKVSGGCAKNHYPKGLRNM